MTKGSTVKEHEETFWDNGNYNFGYDYTTEDIFLDVSVQKISEFYYEN